MGRIWVFGLWIYFDLILLCIGYIILYWLGIFRSLHSLYRALGAGFRNRDGSILLGIMGDHDGSLGFVVFPVFGDIYPRTCP